MSDMRTYECWVYNFGCRADMVSKAEADAVLEAKDKKIAELKEQYKDMDVTHTVHIAKMNAYIEELEENVDFCKKENRGLKRALRLMTAEWAEGMGLASCNIAIKLSVKERFSYHDEANREKDINKYRHRQVVFYKYADCCRAKAEE